MKSLNSILKVALLQTKCVANKQSNLQSIEQAVLEAAQNKAKICFLGEIVNSPYDKKYMREYAEDLGNSETLQLLQKLSKQFGIYTISTIPEKGKTGKLYNTGIVTSPNGELLTKMSKVHLFDINIPGKITYKESEVFSAGDEACVFDTEWGKIGLSICYDLRFAELALLMRQRGAKLLFYPGSFNLTTGPLHWELLLRGRALDTQCYAIGVSTARNKEDTSLYQAWGHSTAVDPFGKILAKMDENPGIQYVELDSTYVDEIREQIPISKQKRNDIYSIRDIKSNL